MVFRFLLFSLFGTKAEQENITQKHRNIPYTVSYASESSI